MDALVGFLVTLVIAYALFIVALEILGELFQFLSENAEVIFLGIFVLIGVVVVFWIATKATGSKEDSHSSSHGSTSTNFHQTNDSETSGSWGHNEGTNSAEHTSSGRFFSEMDESPLDQIEKGWLDLGPDPCPHCDGTGICQDDYHSGGPEIVMDLVIGADCPSGCSGSSIGAGQCPHCDGTGKDE